MAPDSLSRFFGGSLAVAFVLVSATLGPASVLAQEKEPPAAPVAAPVAPVDAETALREGDELYRRGDAAETEAAALFAQAAASYQAALGVTAREKDPRAWGAVQARIAAALVSQGERTVGEEAWDLLEKGKAAARAALESLTEEDGKSWADAQRQLGRGLRAQGSFVTGAEGQQMRTEAIAALRAALRGFDAKKDLYDHAMTQADLGLAYFADSQDKENEPARLQLVEAAAAFRASLALLGKESFAREWGDAQNLLGHCLREQFLRTGAGGDSKLVEAAIGAYEAALSVRSKEQFPVAWLLIKNNIGTALQLLASTREGEERGRLLTQGLASVREALAVTDPETLPQFWMPLRENELGILLDQGDKENATRTMIEILGVPPELGAELKPSLLQILDKLPAELQNNPGELMARLREVLMRSMDPTLQDQHGPAEEPPPAPPATGGGR